MGSILTSDLSDLLNLVNHYLFTDEIITIINIIYYCFDILYHPLSSPLTPSVCLKHYRGRKYSTPRKLVRGLKTTGVKRVNTL